MKLMNSKERIGGKLISSSYFHSYYVNLSEEFRIEFNAERNLNAKVLRSTLCEKGDLYARVYKKNNQLVILELLTKNQITNRKLLPKSLPII
jgi:hypothetical protein